MSGRTIRGTRGGAAANCPTGPAAITATPLRFATRVGARCWGAAPRKIASPKIWSDPYAWDRAAAEAGRIDRVFCMSMGDFLEDRFDLVEPRKRAIEVIERTPHLEWLILTKRIGNARLLPWSPGKFPSNVRVGITVENQEIAERDVPQLLALDVPNFISVEPMLEAIDFDKPRCERCGRPSDCVGDDGCTPFCNEHEEECSYGHWLDPLNGGIEWVICGAESRPGKRMGRPLELDWVRSLRDQCVEAGVPFLYKQGPVNGRLVELPELDGRVWDQRPEARTA